MHFEGYRRHSGALAAVHKVSASVTAPIEVATA